MKSFENYQSPFSWRYGSPEMHKIWGEENKRLIWRKLWLAMAKAQIEDGLVTREQVQDLDEHKGDVDVARALEIEKIIHHDLMAEVKVFAGQCPKGGGILHLGATSMDIKDNAEVLQIAQSMEILISRLRNLLKIMAAKVEACAEIPLMAFTHLQPAEPTTLGYRLGSYAQDLLEDYKALIRVRSELKGKGFKGAVGNAASFVMLLGLDGYLRFERQISQSLELPFFEVTTQTYPRKQDFTIMTILAGLAATAHKIAFDLRLLQSEVIGELAEPFGDAQVGSSAMSFKRNPVEAEKIDSLARAVSTAPLIAWNNYANSLLERTLDDSANRRSLFPETFLSMDEILMTLVHIFEGLKINQGMMRQNLDRFGPFAAVERVMMAAVKNGADRQEMHEVLRQVSMSAWQALQDGQANPLVELVLKDDRITCWVVPADIRQLFKVEGYTGFAKSRALEMANQINTFIQ